MFLSCIEGTASGGMPQSKPRERASFRMSAEFFLGSDWIGIGQLAGCGND
jgi:hypothetical protein